MKPKDAPKIEKATRKEFPDGIPAFGADALRFTMAALAGPRPRHQVRPRPRRGLQELLQQAVERDALRADEHRRLRGFSALGASSRKPIAPGRSYSRHRRGEWILARLAKVAAEAETHFASYRFDLLAQALYEFAWNEFCDWFVELAKPALQRRRRGRRRQHPPHAAVRARSAAAPAAPADPVRHRGTVAAGRAAARHRRRHDLAAALSAGRATSPDRISRAPKPTSNGSRRWCRALRRIRSELGVSPAKTVPLLLARCGATTTARVARFALAAALPQPARGDRCPRRRRSAARRAPRWSAN